jgi:hypothetical protein
MAKIRVNVYIDGFNLYHSTLQHAHPDCRWLNLKTDINIAVTLLGDAVGG